MTRVIDLPRKPEVIAWKWMRYSGLLLIPLAWGHVLIQDVLVDVDRIDLNYVSMRWAFVGWRIYDFFLLVFALAHGINGLRQIVLDFVSKRNSVRFVNGILSTFLLLMVMLGLASLLGGVRKP